MGRRTRLKEVPTKPTPAPVQIIKPDLQLWRAAIVRAQGNIKRIQVISSTEVIIHNNDWRKRSNRS